MLEQTATRWLSNRFLAWTSKHKHRKWKHVYISPYQWKYVFSSLMTTTIYFSIPYHRTRSMTTQQLIRQHWLSTTCYPTLFQSQIHHRIGWTIEQHQTNPSLIFGSDELRKSIELLNVEIILPRFKCFFQNNYYLSGINHEKNLILGKLLRSIERKSIKTC